MLIGNTEYSDAKIGDTFYIIEEAGDRLENYITKYKIIEEDNYFILEANYPIDASFYETNEDLIDSLDFSEYGVQFGDSLEDIFL